MAVLPLNLARVSNSLRTSLAQRSISRTQAALTEVQNQIASGKRIISPSDDPGGAAIAQQLRKTLEHNTAFVANVQHAALHLGEVDSSLGDLTDLLRQAQTIASANAGTIVSQDQRAAASTVIDSLYDQALAIANRKSAGLYLFGGDAGDTPPFESETDGVRFVGSDRALANRFDESTAFAFQTNGNEIFGALSTRVRGAINLAPALSLNTRLVDLAGATDDGISLGSIRISDGTSAQIVDLSGTETVGDVIDRINASGLVTAGISTDGNSLLVSGGPGDDVTITEVGGTVAGSLGILTTTSLGIGTPIDGQSVGPKVTALTRLNNLRGELGMDQNSGLVITNGQRTKTIDLSTATTVEDLLNAINGANLGVLARVDEDGSSIDLLNATQGTSLLVSENGGTTAGDLGLRSFSPSTALADLNGGKGVKTVTGDDLSITRRDGSTFTVDLDGLSTVQDVIDAINAADGIGALIASFSPTTNGIVLTDTTGGSNPLIVTSANFSTAAEDLGIKTDNGAATFTGTDVNGIETTGIFTRLAKLRDALIQNNQNALTDAAEGLTGDVDRVVRVRGQVGGRIQELEARQQRLEDQNLATQSLLSAIEETDFNEAITRFQSLQTTLQANLQTTGQILNLSLFDFLG